MKKRQEIFSLAIPLFISLLFFNAYFFRGKLLFPGNLLVSFYSPWKYETFKEWEHGIPNKPLGFDNLRFFYPMRKEVLTQFSEGKIPLWNPYNFSGNVLLANSQSAVFYPLNILYFFIPFMDAWSLLVVSVPLITGIFTYLFLRSYKLSNISSFFGGLSFAFSGFLIVWMEENPAVSHSAIWLPVALYAIKKFINNQSIRFWFLAIFALVSSVFAGFLQISSYIWIASFVYMIYELLQLSEGQRKKLIFPLMAMFFLSFLISFIQILPSFEAYLESPRITASAAYLTKEYLLPLTFLITLVVPDIFGNPGTHNFFGGGFYYDKILYVGLIPFIFSLYAIFQKRKELPFFIILGSISLFLGIGSPITKAIFGLNIPFFSTVTPSRVFYLTAFSISVLTAFGLESWVKYPDRKILKKIFMIISFLFCLSGLFVISRFVQIISPKPQGELIERISLLFFPGIPFEPRQAMISLRNLIVPLGVFLLTIVLLAAWLKRKKWQGVLMVGLVILFIFHQHYFLKKSLYTTEEDFIFPETSAIRYLKENSQLERIIGVGQARVFPNLLASLRLFSLEGLDPVFSRRYGELINAVNTGAFSTDIPRIEVRLIFDSEKDFNNNRKLKVLSFLGVKFLLVPQENEEKPPKEFILPKNQFEKVFGENGLNIWQNNASFPRCWQVFDFIVQNNPSEIIETMFSDSFNLKNQVVLEENSLTKLGSLSKNDGRVEIVEYNADRIKIKTSATTQSIIFCTENFSSGWKAKIDGRETKIYRANYTFRAIVASEGKHEIIFSHEPLSFKYGSLISVLGLLAAGIYGAALKYLI